MELDSFRIYDLEKHNTKDIVDGHINGKLTVVWRDWDNHSLKSPKMVYITSINSNEIKGPHLHLRRHSFFSCIHGSVIFIIKDKNQKYHEIELSAEKPKLIFIPKNIASAHINIKNETAHVLALADISWKPNDNEMENLNFNDYDWNKWKK
tara:strand:+ start:13131 stop:13583 length:453 start_codon:yes stop_codon:yes gene_type:complete